MKDNYYSYDVYISRSLKDGSLYKGSTNCITKRQLEHDQGKSDYTRNKGPYELIWHCVFTGDKAQEKALKFEKYLKSGSGRASVKKHILLED